MRKLPIVLMGSSLLFGCGISRQEVVKKDNEITSLRGQLTEERNKVKALEERLDTLIPPPPNQAISIKEICAVPDMYVGKEITIKGPLVQPVVFNEPITNFRLFNRGCYVFCAFITKFIWAVSPKSRRFAKEHCHYWVSFHRYKSKFREIIGLTMRCSDIDALHRRREL